MLPPNASSQIKFNPKHQFIGHISKVQIKESNSSLSKFIWINQPKIFNQQTNSYKDFGHKIKDEEGQTQFKFQTIIVELKKQWFDLDVFKGLSVLIFGNFINQDSNSLNEKIIKIPTKSGYKSIQKMNFMTIEPNL
jgi:hypothetical protein